jgi:DegV family protein with EDD domain
MAKVVIVTDSTATIPEDLAAMLDIRVVPVLLVFGSQSLRDGVDVTPSEVYRRLRAGSDIPTSAAPSVGDFLRIYAGAGQDASAILSVHMPPSLSATHGVAGTASRLVEGVPIRVLDSGSAAMGQGFVVIEAARAAAAGASLEEVVKRAEEVAARVSILFTLDTYEYLHRGGRIGGAAALMGTVLQIKPVLHLPDGRIEVLAKPRTKRRAIQRILKQIEAEAGDRPLHAAVFHADVPQEAEDLRNTVMRRFHCEELYVTEFTPVMGAHTGPGLVGVAFYADDEPGAVSEDHG